MKNKQFSGIMPALVTLFDEEGTLKRNEAEKLMTWELSRGAKGFYINGATGEGLFLSERTRMDMAEAAVDTCKGKGVVINHIGAVDALSAVRLAKHAGKIGCDAVSSLVPNYIASYTTEQVLDYYKRIADAAGIPVLVYCTKLVGSAPYDFMKKVMDIDGVIGCKYTMFDYYSMRRITQLNNGDINVLNGPDEMLICGLTMGADGGIGSTYNLMSDRYARLYEKFVSGDIEGARQEQFEINKVIEVLLRYGCIESIKAALEALGFDTGYVAWPGKRFTAEEKRALLADLNAAGYSIG